MPFESHNLPASKERLHDIIISLSHDNEALLSTNEKLMQENNDLKTQTQLLLEEIKNLKQKLTLLRKKTFGKSSEKVKKQISELENKLEDKERQLEQKTKRSQNKNCKETAKREKIPDEIPREDITLDAPKSCPSCGKDDYRKISDDVSESLEYVPARLKVVRRIRPRCVCQSCQTIFQAELPSDPIQKGKAGSGLLAHIMVQKYCNHLPLYRQAEIFARDGIDLSRSTLTGWVAQCASLLKPLSERLKKFIFSQSHIHGDDTPVKVLGHKSEKSKTGRLWTYVYDGRPRGEMSPRAACYFYSQDRKGIRPQEHLKDFQGVLHADAYAGYNAVYGTAESSSGISEAGCWAHMRRKFYEITVASDNARIARESVSEIGKIYDLESQVRGLDPPTRLEFRLKHTKELVDNLFMSFKKALKKLPQKSLTSKAIAYALNNEDALKRFLSDGQIEIDNNAAERALRSVAIGRKNWLFAGSDEGGRTAATIYTLLETAKLNGVNPWGYLRKVLSVIQDQSIQKMAELLPWNLKLD